MIKKIKRRIILVSNSPRRRLLLEQIGLEFETASSEGVDEDTELYPPYHEAVGRLSRLKAESVKEKFYDSILIAADTIVLCNNTFLGKLENNESAAKMLKFLRNKKHHVITGVTLIDTITDKTNSLHETTEVEFGYFENEEIDWYISSGEPFDKAGAYGIQGKAAQFVKRIDGCYYNVMGLPVYALIKALKGFDIELPFMRSG